MFKVRAYNTGSVLSLLALVSLGVLWYMSKYQWANGQDMVILSWAGLVGLFTLGLFSVRKVVYNKNGYELLRQYGWGNIIMFSVGALFISTAVLAGSAFAVSNVIMMLFNVGTGVFA